MRFLAIVFGLGVGLGLVGCGADGAPSAGGRKQDVQLELKATPDGALAYCAGADDCVQVANPSGCDRLLVDIDVRTGESCERCETHDGVVLGEACGADGAVSCSVFSAPEPDCVVCAYVEGAVFYSTCVAAEPASCVEQFNSAGQPCRICYEADGRVSLNTCLEACDTVICEVDCRPGYTPVNLSGECCPVCMPEAFCEGVICPFAEPIPDCPPGSVLRRDPADCCALYCEPSDCSDAICPEIYRECPDGFHMSFEAPHCCGICVEDANIEIGADRPTMCTSTDDCAAGSYCTVETGECLSLCEDGEVCVDVCAGFCRPDARDCAPIEVPACDEGRLVWQGRDADGCPIAPLCLCADGSTSLNGFCENRCAAVDCAPPPVCEPGTHLEVGYPYCCGACVPDGECWVSLPQCDRSSECGSESICQDGFCVPLVTPELEDLSEGRFGDLPLPQPPISFPLCPPANCADNEVTVIGASCCPECVLAPVQCFTGEDCGPGGVCTTAFGDCHPPACDDGDWQCMAMSVCAGYCLPAELPDVPVVPF